jgi:hypothetical protein
MGRFTLAVVVSMACALLVATQQWVALFEPIEPYRPLPTPLLTHVSAVPITEGTSISGASDIAVHLVFDAPFTRRVPTHWRAIVGNR